MMKHEFEALAGYEVSSKDYHDIIEPMYMATDLSKQDFVKCIDRKRFALPTKVEMLRSMRKEAQHLYDICGLRRDHDSEHRLEGMAHEYMRRFYGIDWANDSKAYAFFLNGYEYPDIQRGCTYPRELVLGRGNREYERIALVKKVA